MGQKEPREYEFTLALDGVEEITSELEDALFEAGCDDGTLAVKNGRAFVMFSRVDKSFADAILSAILDVRKAGVEVARVSAAELVSAAEIARRVGRTRQSISQLVAGERGPGGFPGAVSEAEGGKSPLWLWSDVADWLHKQDLISRDALQNAQDVAAINGALDMIRHPFRNKTMERRVWAFVTSFRTSAGKRVLQRKGASNVTRKSTSSRK